MTDLTSHYLGLELRNPLVASAGPHTGDPDSLAQLSDSGAAAVVLPSLFEEQILDESAELNRHLDAGAEANAEAQGYLPEFDEYALATDRYLALVDAARDRVSVPIIASLNAASPGGWTSYARLLEDAGVDALELNVYDVVTDVETGAAEVEQRTIEMITRVRAEIDIPLAVKLSPFYSAIPDMAWRVAEAGADGLVLFNRFYQPDVDIDTLDVVPSIDLSTAADLRLPLRWIAILWGRIDASLACSSGVHDGAGVVKALLAGADVAMMTSALLQHGAGHLVEVEQELVAWMAEHEYESVDQLRGSVSLSGVPDPAAYERSNYRRTLASYPRPL